MAVELKVAIAPGHYEYAGAFANKINEEDMADIFADRIAHYLRSYGIDVEIIQQTSQCPLTKVGEVAVKNNCDLFFSIHFNAGPVSAKGFEAYVVNGDVKSKKIASKILKDICEVSNVKNRGVKWDNQSQHSRLEVLRDTYKHMFSMLFEFGFITNKEEADKIKNARWCENVSQITAKSIRDTLLKNKENKK